MLSNSIIFLIEFGIFLEIVICKTPDALTSKALYSIESNEADQNVLCACDSGFGSEWIGKVVTRNWDNSTHQKWNLTENNDIPDLHCYQFANLGNSQNNIQLRQGIPGEKDFDYIFYTISWNLVHTGEGRYILRSCEDRQLCLTRKGNGQRVTLTNCGYEYRALNPSQIWRFNKLDN